MSTAYIATSRKLLDQAPSQVDASRAISSAYYALFHHVCWHFSQIVIHPPDGEFQRARAQAYRHIDHGPARQRCMEVLAGGRQFPSGVFEFASAFVELQQRRIEADYGYPPPFTPADAGSLVTIAEKAIAAFNTAPAEAQRAFVIFIGLRPRNR